MAKNLGSAVLAVFLPLAAGFACTASYQGQVRHFRTDRHVKYERGERSCASYLAEINPSIHPPHPLQLATPTLFLPLLHSPLTTWPVALDERRPRFSTRWLGRVAQPAP